MRQMHRICEWHFYLSAAGGSTSLQVTTHALQPERRSCHKGGCGCGQVDDRMKLYLSAAAGGMGVLVTLLWVPELCMLDLAEGDLRWAALCRGAPGLRVG